MQQLSSVFLNADGEKKSPFTFYACCSGSWETLSSLRSDIGLLAVWMVCEHF